MKAITSEAERILTSLPACSAKENRVWYPRYIATPVRRQNTNPGYGKLCQSNDLPNRGPVPGTSTARASTTPKRFSREHRPLGEAPQLLRSCLRLMTVLAASSQLVATVADAQARATPGPLTSRDELTTAAERAEIAAHVGDASARARNSSLAYSIRQRLRNGDFQPGDRVVVAFMSDSIHRDTIVVRGGRFLELPGKSSGTRQRIVEIVHAEEQQQAVARFRQVGTAQGRVLVVAPAVQAEQAGAVGVEDLAEQIEVTPLMRVGVLGDVAHPGYFAFASDMPLTDAIMGAGGPTATSDLERSIVRRGPVVVRTADETRTAIANGLTLDQFGLNAGDELVIGQRREGRSTAIIGMVGVLASLTTVFIALRH